MRPLVVLLLSILVRFCAAIAFIPCSVAAPACRSFFLLSPANLHDAPFAQPLLTWAVRLCHIHPRGIRLDAAYWGLRLIAWIHTVLGAHCNPEKTASSTVRSPRCSRCSARCIIELRFSCSAEARVTSTYPGLPDRVLMLSVQARERKELDDHFLPAICRD
jgi:hypothetical protein